MKLVLKIMSIPLGLVLLTHISCSNNESVSDKPIVPSGQLMQLEHSSNADTLFLSWQMVNEEMDFTKYRFSTDNAQNSVEVDRKGNKCFLTNIPYGEIVPVAIEFIKDSEVIKTIETSFVIDGLDTVFASTLIPDKGSVTGGDGTYSIALPDGRSIFLMGDSYIGPVVNGARSMQDHMFRNTYILYDKGEVSAIYGANGSNSSGAVPPGVTNEHNKWYWPGHGFVADDQLYIFQTLMYQGGEGMWGFRYEKTDILRYQLPGLELIDTSDIPASPPENVHYGMASLNDGPYIYVYAQRDVENGLNTVSDAMVARTTIGELYHKWEYFNGSGWGTNTSEAVKMEGLSSVAISSQFNVFKLGDKYVLLTQEKQFLSGAIYTFIADRPEGPWYNKQLIYTTEGIEKNNVFTYNAMAHPQFAKNGKLLVSYNVNIESFEEQHKDVSTYRPRFFWVETEKILNN